MTGALTFETFELDGLHAYLHTVYEDRTEDQVYLDLIWELTDGLARYAIPRYYREAGMHGWGEPYALVDWEYEIDVESDRELKRDSIRGFVPARTSVPRPVHPGRSLGSPTPYAASNERKAGLFRVFRPDTLATVVKELQGDATAELNLFGLAKGPDRLFTALTKPELPRLADILEPGDVFVDLVIGVDLGYSSALLIQAHVQLSERLESLV